jgi:DNA processing protein
MDFPVRQLPRTAHPPLLAHIPDKPTSLWIRGDFPQAEKYLCVVGSRKMSSYGKLVIEHLIGGLAGYPICIVSGLALGVDAHAHRTALQSHLSTIAVPGSGLDDRVLYPRTNYTLAHSILSHGGCLLSEYEPTFKATPWSFPQRNRVMAGMCHATLLIEAAPRSGTLITARLATEYDRELFVVPGSIFFEQSYGVHQFLKLGATPVTSADDIVEHLGMTKREKAPSPHTDRTATEQKILSALSEPLPKDTLVEQVDLSIEDVSIALTMLELDGLITMSSGLITKRVT